MSRASKAVLLSALVFPGTGHFYLKRYKTGISLLVVTAWSFYYLLTEAINGALQRVETMQNNNGQVDVVAMAELLSKQSSGGESQTLSIAASMITICWLFGIIDSYRMGKRQTKMTE